MVAVYFRNSVDDVGLVAVRGGDVAIAATAAAHRRGTPAGEQTTAGAGTHSRTAAEMVRALRSGGWGCMIGLHDPSNFFRA